MSRRLTYEEVSKIFKDNNCCLLEKKYKNYSTPMKYKCECGRISKICLGNLSQGQRCMKCGRRKTTEKQTGENHYNWNPNLTDEDRRKLRIYSKLEVKDWRKDVFKRDNFTCQKCNTRGGKLNAHHKAGWNRREDLRFDVDNGVTLCEDCHKEFHKNWGRGDNYEVQFKLFLQPDCMAFDFAEEGQEQLVQVSYR